MDAGAMRVALRSLTHRKALSVDVLATDGACALTPAPQSLTVRCGLKEFVSGADSSSDEEVVAVGLSHLTAQ